MAKKKQKKRFNTVLQYVLVLAMVGAAFWTGTLYQQVKTLQGSSAKQNPAQVAGTAAANPTAPQVKRQVKLEGDDWAQLLRNPAAKKGQESAKVTIVEFTDYQCPFCKRAFENAIPQIESQYVDTGKVKYLIRDLPLSFHGNAKVAALAARCAGEQGKYEEMHDRLFENQNDWINGTPAEVFKGYASDLGLDRGQFDACYDGKKYEEAIDNDLALASRVGATGTPTFFINGRQVVGAQPFSAFEAVIEEELSK